MSKNLTNFKILNNLKKLIIKVEENLNSVKKLLDDNLDIKQSDCPKEAAKDGKIIEGTFDGENMISSKGKKYSVPVNYASKSKMVPGDKLKLTISEDGTFIYKQIGPVKRKKIIGIFAIKKSKLIVEADGEFYQVLPASVTYFKIKEGDKLTVIIPEKEKSKWAAIEEVLPEE